MNWEFGKKVVLRLMGENPHIRFIVDGNDLIIKPGPLGLTPGQRDLIREHKEEIKYYLSTPPDQQGLCRRGHPVQWKRSENGLWLCGCYFRVPPKPEARKQLG